MKPIQAWIDERAAERAAQSGDKNIASIEAANRAVFLRECKRDGIDPKGGVSPSLLKLIKGEGNGG